MDLEQPQNEQALAAKRRQSLEVGLKELRLLDWIESNEKPTLRMLGAMDAIDLARQTLAYTATT